MELDVAQSIVLRPDEGEVISDRAERTVRIKVGLDAIAVTETRYEPGEPGPDPHIHRGHTDAFYVLEGTLDVKLGPERKTTRLPASSFVAAPPNPRPFLQERGARARPLPELPRAERRVRRLSAGDARRRRRELVRPDRASGRRWQAALRRGGPPPGRRRADRRRRLVARSQGDGRFERRHLLSQRDDRGARVPRAASPRSQGAARPLLRSRRNARPPRRRRDGPAEAGTFACFPPGTVHTFSNPGGEPVRILNFSTPAGWEGYMRELGAAFGGGGGSNARGARPDRFAVRLRARAELNALRPA